MSFMKNVPLRKRLLDNCLQHAGELVAAGTPIEDVEIKEVFSTYFKVLVRGEELFEVTAMPTVSNTIEIASYSKHTVTPIPGWEEWFPPFTKIVQ